MPTAWRPRFMPTHVYSLRCTLAVGSSSRRPRATRLPVSHGASAGIPRREQRRSYLALGRHGMCCCAVKTGRVQVESVREGASTFGGRRLTAAESTQPTGGRPRTPVRDAQGSVNAVFEPTKTSLLSQARLGSLSGARTERAQLSAYNSFLASTASSSTKSCSSTLQVSNVHTLPR